MKSAPYPGPEPFADRLRRSGLPCVMYGTGDGADKLTEELEPLGIEISDYFASDGFVRNRLFRGKRVLSYAETCEKYRDFNVILGFATNLPEVMENIRRIAGERTLIAPDGGVFGGGFWDGRTLADNSDAISRLYAVLADDLSRAVLEGVLNFRVSGDIRYLDGCRSTPDTLYSPLAADSGRIRALCDLGAFRGDTLELFRRLFPSLEYAVALEPDVKTFAKLQAFAADLPFPVECFNAAAWDSETTLAFSCGASRASSQSLNPRKKTVGVEAKTLDSILGGRRTDLIKLDVEGCEKEALLGCRETISRCNPDLVVSLYHRSLDLLTLPSLAAELGTRKRLYLRRPEYYPAWDLALIAADD